MKVQELEVHIKLVSVKYSGPCHWWDMNIFDFKISLKPETQTKSYLKEVHKENDDNIRKSKIRFIAM